MRARGDDGDTARRRTPRVLLALAGLGLAANAAWLAAMANLTLGTAMVALAGSGLLARAGYAPRGRWRLLDAAAALSLAMALGLAGFLAVVGTADTVGDDEDAIVVLGAAVHGREPSRTLASRLDVALAHHQRNPGALVVVSGGQGPQEEITEASAMAAYLLDRGVPAEVIVGEDRSTSTEENFSFSKALLDQRLAPGYRIMFVTDEFHVYRAGRIAAGAGLTTTHASSRTPWYFWAANYLREELAVVADWLT